MRSTGAGAPQSVPDSLLMMLQRDLTLSRTFSKCFFVRERSNKSHTEVLLVQSRVQECLPLVLLSVFWQHVCCQGESRSPLSSLCLGAASSSQRTRSGVRHPETVYSQDVKRSLIV